MKFQTVHQQQKPKTVLQSVISVVIFHVAVSHGAVSQSQGVIETIQDLSHYLISRPKHVLTLILFNVQFFYP